MPITKHSVCKTYSHLSYDLTALKISPKSSVGNIFKSLKHFCLFLLNLLISRSTKSFSSCFLLYFLYYFLYYTIFLNICPIFVNLKILLVHGKSSRAVTLYRMICINVLPVTVTKRFFLRRVSKVSSKSPQFKYIVLK